MLELTVGYHEAVRNPRPNMLVRPLPARVPTHKTLHHVKMSNKPPWFFQTTVGSVQLQTVTVQRFHGAHGFDATWVMPRTSSSND